MCFHIRSCINLAISLEMCVFGVQVLISILGVVDGFGGAAGGLLVVGGLLAAILAAGRGLLALVGGCWRSAGGLLASFGGLLAAFWRLAGGSWRFYWHSWRHFLCLFPHRHRHHHHHHHHQRNIERMSFKSNKIEWKKVLAGNTEFMQNISEYLEHDF